MTPEHAAAQSSGVLDIDHLMCKTDDLDGGRRTFEQLGFMLTPYSRLPIIGGGNSLILFKSRDPAVANFLELAFPGSPPTPNPLMAKILDAGEGPKTMVFMTHTDRAHATWRELGLAVPPVIPLKRVTELPDGGTVHYDFKVVIPEPGQTPLMFNGYETNTLSLYSIPQFQNHPNGAQHWHALTAVTSSNCFEEVVSLYEKILGVSARRSPGRATIRPGQVEFRILIRDIARTLPFGNIETTKETFYLGFTIEVESLARVRDFLARSGIQYASVDGAVYVAPKDACGNLIEFFAR